MSLPVVTSIPTQIITLPISKLSVKHRAFTVGESKKMLLLREAEGSMEDVIDSIQDVVKACTFGKVDVTKISLLDLEFLFLKIQTLSRGTQSEQGYKCNNLLPDGKTECGHLNTITVDLAEVQFTNSEQLVKSFPIPGTNIQLHFRLPTIELLLKFSGLVNKGQKIPPADEFFALIQNTLDSVTDGDTLYSVFDETELKAFLDSLPVSVFEEVQEKFVANIPRMYKEVPFKCEKCGHEEVLRLEGMKDFF